MWVGYLYVGNQVAYFFPRDLECALRVARPPDLDLDLDFLVLRLLGIDFLAASALR